LIHRCVGWKKNRERNIKKKALFLRRKIQKMVSITNRLINKGKAKDRRLKYGKTFGEI
jgi:hypothetical protein